MTTQPTPGHKCQENAFFFFNWVLHIDSLFLLGWIYFTQDFTFPPFKFIFTTISLEDGRPMRDR